MTYGVVSCRDSILMRARELSTAVTRNSFLASSISRTDTDYMYAASLDILLSVVRIDVEHPT